MARRDVSDTRKGLYYAGNAIGLVGVILFLSTFLSAAMNFGNFNNFQARSRSMALRSFGGMVLILVGGALSAVGKQGLAGSGVVLDPEKAREDQEPWSRMQGGMAKDALDEAGVDLGEIAASLTGRAGAKEEVHGGVEMPFDEKLRRLHALHQDGLLTDEEYAREKQELLDRN